MNVIENRIWIIFLRNWKAFLHYLWLLLLLLRSLKSLFFLNLHVIHFFSPKFFCLSQSRIYFKFFSFHITISTIGHDHILKTQIGLDVVL